MATVLKKRVIPNFGFGVPSRSSIVPDRPAKPKEPKGKSKPPKSDHPAFEAESDSEPNESDEEWGNKGLLQPSTRPLTILSNRASGLPSSPARVYGLPGLPARRVPGQSTIAPLRAATVPTPSSALARPPLQPHFPEQSAYLPPSQPIPLQEAQSQVPPFATVLSSQVQTPTVYVSHSRSLPPDDAQQPPRTLSPESSPDLLSVPRPPSPETPAFDIIDAYDYIKRVTLDEQQRQQQGDPDVISPVYVPPPFTYTNVLTEEPIAGDEDESFSHLQLALGQENTTSFSHLHPVSETGPFRASHDVDLPTLEDGPSPLLPPPENPSGAPQVEAQWTSRPLLEIERAPPYVRSPEALSNSLRLENNSRTPSPHIPTLSIVTPTVPPVPRPIGPIIVGGANAPHRRTPLSIPGEVLSPGEESSPVTYVGLARTPRTANFEVIMFGMGEDKVGRAGPANVGFGATLPPSVDIPEEARGVQQWQTSSVPAPIRREILKVKAHWPQGSVGRVEGGMVEAQEGRIALPGRQDSDTSAVAREEEPEEYDEDDDGEFEMVNATDVAKSEPPGRLNSISGGNVEKGKVHTAVKVSLPPALSPLLSLRSSSSSSSDQGVGDEDWYPSLPTDGGVDLAPKNRGKPTPKPVPAPAREAKGTNQGGDIVLKGLGRPVENRLPPVRPPRPAPPTFGLRMLEGMFGGEEKQSERIEQFEDHREQEEDPVTPARQGREVNESVNEGDQSAIVLEPVQVTLPMRIPMSPFSFHPLDLTLDTVSLSDMLGESAAPAVAQPRVQVDSAPILKPKEAKKQPSGSALRPAPGDSDIFGEAASWKPAPVHLPVEPVTSSDGSQDKFGTRDLGRSVGTVQGARRGFDSSSPDQPHLRTLPSPNKTVFGPLTRMPPDMPLRHSTRPLPPLPIPDKSVFEAPTLVPTNLPNRSTIPPPYDSGFEPPTSLPTSLTLPPVPTSTPPRPKDTSVAVREPTIPRVPPPKYRAPSPPPEGPYKNLSSSKGVSANTPFDLAPVADRSYPPVVPPLQMTYHPRSTSLPDNHVQASFPQFQSSSVVLPPPNRRARPFPPNDSSMDKTMERATRSYYENTNSGVSPFPPAGGKEKKKTSLASVVSSLLKAKKVSKAAKAKYGLESIEEREVPGYPSEQGYTKQEYKQGALSIEKPVPPPKQLIGQAYMSPPPVAQQSPPAFTNVPPQSLPTQGTVVTSRGVQPVDRWVPRERVQPTATGGFATDDIQDQSVPDRQDEMNPIYQFPPRMQASQDPPSPSVSSSRLPVVPPLNYSPSVPIATYVTSISACLEAEREVAMSGGAPIPSLNTVSISYIISTLSQLNARIGKACAVLTKVIVSARIATGESGASPDGAHTQRMSTKVERDMRTRLCEFLTGSIFGRFSVALDSEDDQVLREAHGECFVRYPQPLSARWRVLACTSTAPPFEEARTIFDSLLRAGIGEVLGNSNPHSTLVLELSAFLRPVFNIALELSACIHMDMVEHDYGVFAGTPLGGVVDLQVEENHDQYVAAPPGARIRGFWSLGLRRARWEGEGEERRRCSEVLVKPRVYVDSNTFK